jgi:hypothetical protein
LVCCDKGGKDTLDGGEWQMTRELEKLEDVKIEKLATQLLGSSIFQKFHNLSKVSIETPIFLKEMKNEIIVYRPNELTEHIEVRIDKETVWLSQKEIAMLFDKDSDTIGLHLRNIYKTEELNKHSTTEKSSVVQIY